MTQPTQCAVSVPLTLLLVLISPQHSTIMTSGRHPLAFPEVVDHVFDNVPHIPDLWNCACVNSTWFELAIRRLYRGSLYDMQFCTPEINALNCIYTASRDRFRKYMSHVRHFVLAPEMTAPSRYCTMPQCLERFRPLLDSDYAQSVFQVEARNMSSLVIPADMSMSPVQRGEMPLFASNCWAGVFFTPRIQYLAVDFSCCMDLSRACAQTVSTASLYNSSLMAAPGFQYESSHNLQLRVIAV